MKTKNTETTKSTENEKITISTFSFSPNILRKDGLVFLPNSFKPGFVPVKDEDDKEIGSAYIDSNGTATITISDSEGLKALMNNHAIYVSSRATSDGKSMEPKEFNILKSK